MRYFPIKTGAFPSAVNYLAVWWPLVALLALPARPAAAGEGGSLRPAGTNTPVMVESSAAPLIELDGSISVSPDGGELTYRWEQLSGPPVTLSSHHTAKPQFRTAVPGVYEFQLIVSANGLDSEPHVVRLEIERENAPPVARLIARAAGQVGKAIELDGSGSFDPEGEEISYLWRPVTPGLEIPAEALSRPVLTFEPNADGEFEIELVVSDGEKSSQPVRCLLAIKPRPRPPVAQARIVTVEIPTGATATQTTLPAVAAAPGDTGKAIPSIEPLPELKDRQNAWVASEVEAAGVANPALAAPMPAIDPIPPTLETLPLPDATNSSAFAAPERQRPISPEPPLSPFPDGGLAPMAAPDAVIWTPSQPLITEVGQLPAPPPAEPAHAMIAPVPPLPPTPAEPQLSMLPVIPETYSAPRPTARINAPFTAQTGKVIMLDARDSYAPTGNRLEYAWRQIAGPAVEQVELVLDGAAERFVAPLPGEYEFELVVADGGARSDPVTHRLQVEKEPDPPVAVVVAPTHALPDSLVRMDATQSYDPLGGQLVYRWRQTGGPKVTDYVIDERLGNSAPAFRPVAEGLYSFSLSVFNGVGSSQPVDIDIEVTEAARRTPGLSIGGPDRAKAGDRLVLNATATDATGWNLSYEWEQTEGPARALSPSGGIRAMVTPPAGGRYAFLLTARDEAGREVASASKIIEVGGGRANAAAPPATSRSEAGGRIVPSLTPLPNSRQSPLTFPEPQARRGGRNAAEVLQGGK